MHPIETIEYRHREIYIYPDETAENPREMFDNFGHLICWHSRYNLGDKHNFSNPAHFLESLYSEATGKDPCELFDKYTNERCEDIMQKAIARACIILPVSAYEHGGITIKTGHYSCPWDSGQVGWIYITRKAAREEMGWKKLSTMREAKVRKMLEAEVREYADYLEGAVYGYQAGEDSCWGFYGYDHEKSGLMEQARNAIDCLIDRERKDRKEEKRARKEEARERIRKANERAHAIFNESCRQEFGTTN